MTLITLYENSFITLEDAEEYFSMRLNSCVWDNSGDNTKEKALITASKKINQLNFIGDKKTYTQAMEFPRVFNAHICHNLIMPELPQEISDAVCEEAIALIEHSNSVHLKNQSLGISSISLGVGSVSYDGKMDLTQVISPEAERLLSKWTRKGFDISQPKFAEGQ